MAVIDDATNKANAYTGSIYFLFFTFDARNQFEIAFYPCSMAIIVYCRLNRMIYHFPCIDTIFFFPSLLSLWAQKRDLRVYHRRHLLIRVAMMLDISYVNPSKTLGLDLKNTPNIFDMDLNNLISYRIYV